MTDIFISYSSKDKNIADAICAKLEQNNIKCWIAPRDIQPGEEYAAGLVRGIDNCKCMVVVFSETSNNSKHVLREVERAVGRGVVIIPFRIEDVVPTESMDYFLKVAHWLDAKDFKMDKAIDTLARTIADILNQKIIYTSVSDNTSSDTETVKKEKIVSEKKVRFLFPTLFIIVVCITFLFFFMNGKLSVPDLDNVIPDKTSTADLSPEEIRASKLKDLIQGNESLLDKASRQNIDSTLDISLQIPNKALNIKAWLEPNRSQFMEGDTIRLKVTLDRSAYLAVLVHSMDGSSYLIYPNNFSSPEKILKDTIFTVGSGEVFELYVSEPFGIDIVQFIATTDLQEFKSLFSEYSPIQNMNIATVNRDNLEQKMRGIKAKGIIAIKSSNVTDSNNKKLWGEALILINTKAKE